MEEHNTRYEKSAEMFHKAQNKQMEQTKAILAGFKDIFIHLASTQLQKIVSVLKRTTFKGLLMFGQSKPMKLILTFYLMYLYNHIFNYDSRFDSY